MLRRSSRTKDPTTSRNLQNHVPLLTLNHQRPTRGLSLRKIPVDESIARNVIARKGCSCCKNCSTKICGCVKRNVCCGEFCKCGDDCQNGNLDKENRRASENRTREGKKKLKNTKSRQPLKDVVEEKGTASSNSDGNSNNNKANKKKIEAQKKKTEKTKKSKSKKRDHQNSKSENNEQPKTDKLLEEASNGVGNAAAQQEIDEENDVNPPKKVPKLYEECSSDDFDDSKWSYDFASESYLLLGIDHGNSNFDKVTPEQRHS